MARVINLTSPYTRGSDVKSLQRAIRHILIEVRHESTKLQDDGVYGPISRDAEAHCAWALGVATPHDHKRAQAVIRHPNLRTPAELARAAKYKKHAKAREGTGPQAAVKFALELARRHPPITENPPGSNWGGLISTMQEEVGISHTYWCGAAAHYVLKHGGGINVDRGIVYCPNTERFAKTGTGGFDRWVSAANWADAPVGSLPLYDEGGIAGHVGFLLDKIINPEHMHTAEGNTSSGPGGPQSDGGGFFERRDRGVFTPGFPVRGFAVPRWKIG
jgi:hypothetical protein